LHRLTLKTNGSGSFRQPCEAALLLSATRDGRGHLQRGGLRRAQHGYPAGEVLRALGATGAVGPQDPRPLRYAGRRAIDVVVDFDARRVKVGESVEGTVLGLCR
jgi:hypothetical protein